MDPVDEEFIKLIDKYTTRRCGNCDLCCSALEVFDLVPQKPMGQRCPHQCVGKTGCTIYENRPHTCAVFYCAWRAGSIYNLNLPKRLYPAKCGFVLHYDPGTNDIIMTLFKDPKRPNAWKKYKRDLELIAYQQDIGIAIGGGYQATHVLSPRGNWFSRAEFPSLFDGLRVALPTVEFRNARRSYTGQIGI